MDSRDENDLINKKINKRALNKAQTSILDLGPKPGFQSFPEPQERGHHPYFWGVLFQRVGSATQKACFLGPKRWQCLMEGTWSASTLLERTGWAEIMGASSLSDIIHIAYYQKTGDVGSMIFKTIHKESRISVGPRATFNLACSGPPSKI